MSGTEKKNVQRPRKTVEIDVSSLRSVAHDCTGCAAGKPCCCSTYEVCVTTTEMRRIIRFMPEIVKLCPDLATDDGYDNVFEKVEPGLYAIDTDEDGLCSFAYTAKRQIRCALHTVGLKRGLALTDVKPKACLLWPMTFSDGDEVLSLTDDALLFHCNTLRRIGSRTVSAHFTETIDLVYGDGNGRLVEKAAAKGGKRLKLVRRR